VLVRFVCRNQSAAAKMEATIRKLTGEKWTLVGKSSVSAQNVLFG